MNDHSIFFYFDRVEWIEFIAVKVSFERAQLFGLSENGFGLSDIVDTAFTKHVHIVDIDFLAVD